MTPSIRDAVLAIKLKVRELHAQLTTLTATLAILNGKHPGLAESNDDTPKERRSHRDQFDNMMSVLSAHKGKALRPRDIRKELAAKGQETGGQSTLFTHLARAVELGYALRSKDGYAASPTIQQMMQKAAPKPSKARHVNGVAAPKLAHPNNYAFVLDALRAADGPLRAGEVHLAANKLGASLTKDTYVYGFLTRAVKQGVAKKSKDGYQITKKGSAVEAPLSVTHGVTEI